MSLVAYCGGCVSVFAKLLDGFSVSICVVRGVVLHAMCICVVSDL